MENDFGIWVKNKLIEKGMPQTELAKLTKLTPESLSRIIKGNHTPRIKTIKRIKDVLEPSIKPTKGMTHNIKIKESFSDAVNRGDKTFEVRKNDRGYQKGDHVRFEVLYDSDGCEMIDHPLSKKCFEITYVLSGWGIEDGYCVFGIKQL